ncbi:protein PXR1-like [Trichosurus vulpecula]|uniref:protein PXR1-like n=1 Tax=Trichosurus vulpecula TaxID=9337 RepID=UPI00186AD863|nr:protein PXR1-like [Trichosurus vulpecula]
MQKVCAEEDKGMKVVKAEDSYEVQLKIKWERYRPNRDIANSEGGEPRPSPARPGHASAPQAGPGDGRAGAAAAPGAEAVPAGRAAEAAAAAPRVLAHEDPMYDIIRENKRHEKDVRIQQLKKLLEDSTSDEDGSTSSSSECKEKHKRKKKKEKHKKRKKEKKKKKKKKHKSKSNESSNSD